MTEASGGRLKLVSNFDTKAEVERYIRSKRIPGTFVLPRYFMTNFTAPQMLKKAEDGIFTVLCGDNAEFPLIDTEADTSNYVVAAIRNYPKVLGKQILAASDYYGPARIISEFEEVTGKKDRVN
ncbi:hypothetical protein N8T08_006099 [Aspergillus melleus]|uniref:Uncharacterized protein n=1 Tax=Aspergillus melleus TaxID=138277 RepID=A0ACC3B071_9EURO|nr:hypothetical protein N8T08_006099 [Aspergillus melleus]